MKYITIISAAAALWLNSAIEQGIVGAWADWCLFGILLLWTGFIIRMKLWERREKKCRTMNRVRAVERT